MCVLPQFLEILIQISEQDTKKYILYDSVYLRHGSQLMVFDVKMRRAGKEGRKSS